MLKRLKNELPNATHDQLVSGFRSGMRRGQITKGARLAQQMTGAIEALLIDIDDEEMRDFNVGVIIGLAQWVESNTIPRPKSTDLEDHCA